MRRETKTSKIIGSLNEVTHIMWGLTWSLFFIDFDVLRNEQGENELAGFTVHVGPWAKSVSFE